MSRQRAYATYTLIGVNLLVFALEESAGGSQNPDTLFQLGGMLPEAVAAGEWWRLVSANFLHFGSFHLLVNMVALYALGTWLEPFLGLGKFLVCYFVSGMGAMLVSALVALAADFSIAVVGASGAVMGLLGSITAILLRSWQREKVAIAAQGLQFVLLIIALQVGSDLLNPQVSIVGHVSGLILGFLLGGILRRR